MKRYRSLTLPQRYEIYAVKKAGHNQVAIAGLVGLQASTVSRELRRNASQIGDYAQAVLEVFEPGEGAVEAYDLLHPQIEPPPRL